MIQAIKNDEFDRLVEAVREMKEIVDTRIPCLDICKMVPEIEPNKEAKGPGIVGDGKAQCKPRTNTCEYPMTLLAFAGYYGRSRMLKFLISKGARKNKNIYMTLMCLLYVLDNYMHLSVFKV